MSGRVKDQGKKAARPPDGARRLSKQLYETELYRLQGELLQMQEWMRARINMIAHLLSTIPYQQVREPTLKLPPRPAARGYVRVPRDMQAYVPDHAAELIAADRG